MYFVRRLAIYEYYFLYCTLVSQSTVIVDIHYGCCYIFVI